MKTLIVIGILLVALTGVAQAADGVFSGPVKFNIVVTEEERVDSVRKLANLTMTFNGTMTVDLTLDPEHKRPEITMEGTADGTSIAVECPFQDTGAASAKGDNSKKPVNDKFSLVASCTFTAVDSETLTGIAFLNVSGTLTRPKASMSEFPTSIRIKGSKFNGGGPGFVLSGTFAALLEPQP